MTSEDSVSRFQTRTVPSAAPETRTLPSREKAMSLICSLCPERVRISFVSRFISLTVFASGPPPLLSAAARVLPSGEKATARTYPVAHE